MKTLLLLSFCILSSSLGAAELSLYFIKPLKPFHRKTPQSHHLSSTDYRPQGHVNVRVKCDSANRYGVKQILTGMSQENIKIDDLGRGSLFHDFKGSLDKAKTAQVEINQAKKDRRLNGAKFIISEDSCQELLNFAESWIRNSSYEHYGLALNPSAGQGAGSGSFGAEFMFRTGLKEYTYEWVRRVLIPESLIGTEEGRLLNIYDPELMYNWIEKLVVEHSSGSYYKLGKDGKSKFIIVEAHHLQLQDDQNPDLRTNYKIISIEEQKKQWKRISVE